LVIPANPQLTLRGRKLAIFRLAGVVSALFAFVLVVSQPGTVLAGRSTMKSCPEELDLKESIDRLERALLTPVLSGEVVQWVKNVQEAAVCLDEAMQPFFNGVLHADYKEIAKSDNELLYRVEQMVAEERKLLERKDHFQQRLQHLADRAPHVHSDEAKVASRRRYLAARGGIS
jgi:hypothetical protein